ncbi:hypothetical protein Tco_0871928 [Tanacetum coccineum]
MSRAYYNKIREKSFQACRNPYQPYKFCNFIGRAKNVHIFIGCFVYVVNFMILEDLGSIIDSGLSEVVLGQPFAHTSKLTYDESLGLIRFAQRDDEVIFRMPQRTKELDLISSLENDKLEAFFVENLKVRKKGFKHVLEKRKGYYKACMNLGRFRKPAFVCIVVDMSRENASSVERIPSHSDASGGSTVCWASFGEETDEITDLHQILEEVLLTEHGDGIASIKGTL